MNFVAASKWIHEHDKTRPVHYEQADNKPHVDIVSHMYQPAADMAREAGNGDPRPLIQCEYSHAMGNSNGGFDEYWKLFEAGTRARGGAIWDWVDQGHETPLPPRVVVKDRTKHALTALFVGTTDPGMGAEGYLSLPDADHLDLRDALTLEAVLYPRPALMGAAYPHVARFHPYVSKGDLGFQLMQDVDAVQLWLRFPGEREPVLARAKVPADWYGAWHRLTGTYDGRVARLYVDGKPVAAVEKAGRLSPGHFPLNVGRNPERIDVRTPARLREARVYSRALTEAEVAAPESRRDDGLALWLNVADAKQASPGGGGFYFAYGGDFGPTTTPSDENFCQNGVVSADRTPHPGMGEITKQQQYVDVVPVDLAKGVVSILNRYDFTTLSEIAAARFQVRADDRVVAEGALPALDIAPHATKQVSVPIPAITPEPGVEYWLDVTFALKADTPWAKAGHVLAREQMRLPVAKPAPAFATTALPELTVTGGTKAVVVKGADFAYGFDPATGLLTSVQWKGAEMLAGPLRPDFWRAPNDNDRGSDMTKRLGIWRDAHRFLAVRSFRNETPAKGVVRLVLQADLASVKSRYDVVYTIYGTGDLVVEASFDPGEAKLPDLPRFGMQAKLVPGYEQLTWYGPGPEETYSDRRDRPVGVYATTVADNYFRYSQPQETGNKVEARWAAVTDASGRGPDGRRPAARLRERAAPLGRGHGPGRPPPPDDAARRDVPEPRRVADGPRRRQQLGRAAAGEVPHQGRADVLSLPPAPDRARRLANGPQQGDHAVTRDGGMVTPGGLGGRSPPRTGKLAEAVSAAAPPRHPLPPPARPRLASRAPSTRTTTGADDGAVAQSRPARSEGRPGPMTCPSPRVVSDASAPWKAPWGRTVIGSNSGPSPGPSGRFMARSPRTLERTGRMGRSAHSAISRDRLSC